MATTKRPLRASTRRLYDLATLLAVREAVDRISQEPGFSFNQWLQEHITAAKRGLLKAADAEEREA